MNARAESGLPADLPLAKASFYSSGSSITCVTHGRHRGYEYVTFDYDSQNGDMSHRESIAAIKADSPRIPDTNLSRASGLQIERAGKWIIAFEARRILHGAEINHQVDDVINLIEYAKDFPQNL